MRRGREEVEQFIHTHVLSYLDPNEGHAGVPGETSSTYPYSHSLPFCRHLLQLLLFTTLSPPSLLFCPAFIIYLTKPSTNRVMYVILPLAILAVAAVTVLPTRGAIDLLQSGFKFVMKLLVKQPM